MLRYGINDRRRFYENDVRFWKQFRPVWLTCVIEQHTVIPN